METSTVKFELNAGKRGLLVMEGVTPEIKNVKRKRRKSDGTVTPAQVVDHSFSTIAPATPAAGTSTVKRSSRFRGVSRHRWTGRYEAHLWDKASWNVTQKKKGKQVYLAEAEIKPDEYLVCRICGSGAYDEEESAARAYDLAALKYWGATTITNFPVSDYENDIKMMQNVTKEEYLASLRRKSSGFSRGVSKYRGVARHHHNGRWEARIGRVFGNKYLYLGTYSTQEEAAHAYDVAAIEYRGINAVTNFDLSTYIRWLRPEANTNTKSNCSHEPKPMSEFQAIQSSSTNIQSQESDSFVTDDLSSQLKQEYFQKDTLLSSCSKPSSPTALSLLFRSSIFRELLLKNSNTTNTEAENDEENGGIFYNNLYGNPYAFSKENSRNSLDLQEQEESISIYDQCNSFGIMR